MHDEFVAFEKMVATKDFDSVAKRLEHSRQVMEVLDQAESFVTYKKTSSGISHCLFCLIQLLGMKSQSICQCVLF